MPYRKQNILIDVKNLYFENTLCSLIQKLNLKCKIPCHNKNTHMMYGIKSTACISTRMGQVPLSCVQLVKSQVPAVKYLSPW